LNKQSLPFERIERKELVRREAETSAKFGCRPQCRSIGELIKLGVVNIDKPRGPTRMSHVGDPIRFQPMLRTYSG